MPTCSTERCATRSNASQSPGVGIRGFGKLFKDQAHEQQRSHSRGVQHLVQNQATATRHDVPAARATHDIMANAIRALAMDAVEAAKSGHPGLPMGAADVATVLFGRYLKFDPSDPAWP